MWPGGHWEERWFGWSLFSNFSETGMNFIHFIITLPLYRVLTDDVNSFYRLGDFKGLVPSWVGIKPGPQATARHDSVQWLEKKSATRMFPDFHRKTVSGDSFTKIFPETTYDFKVVSPWPTKHVIMLNYWLVERLWGSCLRGHVLPLLGTLYNCQFQKETDLGAALYWTAFWNWFPPPTPAFLPCLSSLKGYNSECLENDVMIWP